MVRKRDREVTSDLDLIKRAKEGDEKAFAEIVRRNEQMVFSYAFKVCRDRNYAGETLQDTFVNVYRKLGQFDGRSKFSTWLYSIVTNICLMKRRRSKLEQDSVSLEELEDDRSLQPDDAPATQPAAPEWVKTPHDETMTSELRRHLDESIQKLPVEYRLVFVLRDIEGRSAEETSKIMSLTVPAVKSRLRRARVFLKEQLQEYMTR
jgi:RNA polymerase sigma-70 factor, ECF subfamily